MNPRNPAFWRSRWRLLDLILLIALAAGAGLLVWKIQMDFRYPWNWGAVPQFFAREHPEEGWQAGVLLQGLFTTLKISIWAILLASLLGLLGGLARSGSDLAGRALGLLYVGTIRNIPPLVLVFIGYFFLADQILDQLGLESLVRSLPPAMQHWVELFAAPPARINAFVAAVLTLALYEGAYLTEILRAGIQSIDRGQWEASQALGLPTSAQLRHVILPQTFRRILPPTLGQYISTVKDSAIVSVISIQELTFQGQELVSATYLTFEVWICVALLYLLLSLGLSSAARRIEHRSQIP